MEQPMLTREDVEALRGLIDLVVSRGDQEVTPEEWALACDLDVGAGAVLRSLGVPLPHSYYHDRLPGTGLAIHGGPTTRFLDADPGWVGAMRAVLRRAEARLLPHDKAATHVDGPEPPRFLWCGGSRYKIRPRHSQMLGCLWGRERVEAAKLRESVWEAEGQEIEDVTFRAELTKLNTRLDEIGVPYNWNVDGAYVVRTSTRPPS
jgi:hypothetical protein